jgi:hypothetical protein
METYYSLEVLCISVATRKHAFRMRADKTDRHVTEVLRPKPDLQAWNILCEASRHDDPAIKNIADEKYSARVIDQHRRPRPPEHLVHSIVCQITLDDRGNDSDR